MPAAKVHAYSSSDQGLCCMFSESLYKTTVLQLALYRGAGWPSYPFLPALCPFKAGLCLITTPDIKFYGTTSGKMSTGKSKSWLSCTQHLFCSLSMPKPNIINIFQIIQRLWSAKEFGFEICSGEITRKSRVQVILLACNTLTWPDICPNQILSNHHE